VPRKVFVAGEILTAADVNTNLMDQAVMVFDDAAARDTAIPSPAEGMVVYLKSTEQLLKYTTAWVPVDTNGFIATNTALKTDAETFTSVSAGGVVDVTGLSITHTLQSASNKLMIMAFFGSSASGAGFAGVGLQLVDGSTIIGAGASAGSRSRVSSGGFPASTSVNFVTNRPNAHILYSPGDTASHTYKVRAYNQSGVSQNLFINRNEVDGDAVSTARTVSAITIMEVSV